MQEVGLKKPDLIGEGVGALMENITGYATRVVAFAAPRAVAPAPAQLQGRGVSAGGAAWRLRVRDGRIDAVPDSAPRHAPV